MTTERVDEKERWIDGHNEEEKASSGRRTRLLQMTCVVKNKQNPVITNKKKIKEIC